MRSTAGRPRGALAVVRGPPRAMLSLLRSRAAPETQRAIHRLGAPCLLTALS
ncbi:hypothetical protein [Sorangium sp. So ce176]|uniref:hypothetical protein n=1 Tax=Sorangium sp. So ce176 TaxID=3133286 RepID=UPI003F5F8D0C